MRQAVASMLFFLATSAAASAAVEIRDFQAAHGRYGPRRENLEVFAGEEVFFRYVVKGIKLDSLGRYDVDLEERVTNADGRTIAHAKIPQHSRLALGGDSFTGQAQFTFNDELKPGSYMLNLTVTDNISGESAIAERLVTLKPAAFAIVMPRFSYDAAGEIPAPAAGLLGQTLHTSVKALGLDANKGVLDAEMKLQIYDAQGKPTMAQPITVNFRQDDPNTVKKIGLVRFKAEFALNRVGNFTLKMIVTDRVAGKSATFESPLVVTAP